MSYQHGGAYTQDLTTQATRLLAAYFAAPAPEKVAIYVNALKFKAIAADRAARAVDELIASHPKCPAPAQLISAALGNAGRSPGENERRARDAAQMRDSLERLCDFDAWAFKDAFGVWPDRRLYERMNVVPPASMTFLVYPRAECDARRQEAIDACRAAFNRLRTAKRAPLVAPEPVAESPPRGQLALEPDEPENLLASSTLDEPPIGDEPVFDDEEIAA